MASKRKAPDKGNIQPGDKVADPLSGLKGIVHCRAAWLYGCVRISFQPDGNKDGKPFDLVSVDEPQLTVTARRSVKPDAGQVQEAPAGPRDDAAATSRRR